VLSFRGSCSHVPGPRSALPSQRLHASAS
jgi:hypothetical protein